MSKINSSKYTINISIELLATRRRLILRYGPNVQRQWWELARTAHAFRSNQDVQKLLATFPLTAREWDIAQLALDRLGAVKAPTIISVDEAHYCRDLVTTMLLFSHTAGTRWEWTRAVLITMARIDAYEFHPLEPLDSTETPGRAEECYNLMLDIIGKHPGWLSVDSIHTYCLEFEDYKGIDPRILTLKARLEKLCRNFHQLLEVLNRDSCR